MNCRKINLSIVLTVYNKEKYIHAVYDSYVAQLFDNYEIIFVDDNSTDNSKVLLKDLEKKDSRLKVIINNTNKGPSVRLNQGIAIARGEYILLADGDDVCRENALKTLVNLMNLNKVKFLFARYGGHRTTFASYSELPKYPDKIKNYKLIKSPLDHVIKKRQIGMGILIHKDLLSIAPLCDERIFVQDISLHLNLAKNSDEMIVVDEPFLFGFNNNSSSLSMTNFEQGIHDLIQTYYLFLMENDTLLTKKMKNKLVDKACTAIFKYYRKYSNPPIYDLIKVYMLFIQGRLRLYSNHGCFLEKLLYIFKKNNSIKAQDYPHA